MGTTAYFYTFSKRYNSTAVPDIATGSPLDVELKGGADLLSPVFLLNYAAGIPIWNYVTAFNKKYFIRSIRNIRANLWEIYCDIDVLGTYKYEIKASSALVIYDTTANTQIVDARMAPKSTATIASNSVKLCDAISAAGSVVVCLTGERSVGSYVIPQGNVNKLMPDVSSVYEEFIEGDTVFDAIKGGLKQLVGCGSVADNIKSCFWLPFFINGDAIVTPLKLGMYELEIGGSIIGERIQTYNQSINIPWQFNDWRNNAPYTEVYMYIPFVGVVSYAASDLMGKTAISITTSLNKQSGEVSIMTHIGNQVLGKYTANTAIQIPIGSSNINPVNVASGAIGAAGAILAGNAVGVAASAITAISPQTISVGGTSGGADVGLGLNAICYTVCHDTVDSPANMNTLFGSPCMQVKSLMNLTGYVQTQDYSIKGVMTQEERDMINSMMDGGVYFE